LRQQVRLTVAEMPEKLREVLVMCDIQGMAYEQMRRSWVARLEP
jgi:DNA-directed RNA polymerase specialized sigma24 family protein